jgi:hypothetical protein
VIVPDAALIEHWIGQVGTHVNAPNRRGEFGPGIWGGPGLEKPLRVLAVGGMSRKEADELSSTTPRAGDPPGVTRAATFPPAETLARDYDVVLSTFERMSNKTRDAGEDILRVHFLRLIVDEGHLLGSIGAETTRVQRVRAVRAERRWMMTGTPAPAVQHGGGGGEASYGQTVCPRDAAAAPHRAAAALHPLLDLIRAAPFGSSRALWADAVLKPLQFKKVEGAWILRRALSRLVVRASKAELGLLPPLTRRAVRVPFTPSHAASFNQLANLVRRNLLMADWNDPDHQESLLHVRRSQYARELYLNVRKACCVAGAVRLAPQEEDLCEMLVLICQRRGLPTPEAWDFDLREEGDGRGSSGGGGGGGGGVVGDLPGLPKNVVTFQDPAPRAHATAPSVRGGEERARKTEGARGRLLGAHLPGGITPGSSPPWLPPSHPLSRLEDVVRNGGDCASCATRVNVSLTPPCGCGVLCPSCAERSPRTCAKCNTPYEMQPVEDPSRKAHNDNPKWAVPRELIEWQPAYAGVGAEGHRGGTWTDDWRSTDSSKVTWLLERLRSAGAAPPEDASDAAREDAEAAATRVFTAEGMEWIGEAGGFNRWEPSVSLDADDADARDHHRDDLFEKPMKPPPIGWRASRKAVVYSAFWEHVALIRARLRAEGVPHATMLRHERASIKASELERFRHDPTCGVLVMDTSGVVGLDLSFASLVIAMEPVPDGSVLAQLEARAHRMGQARPIHWSPYDRVRVVNADP